MKKTLILIFAMALILLMSACADNTTVEEAPEKGDDGYTEEELAKLFEQPIEEAELCYLSAFANDGFESYLYAFEESGVKGAAALRGVDYDTFVADVTDGLTRSLELVNSLYGDAYEVGYVVDHYEQLEGEDFEALKETLTKYGVDTSLVTEAVHGYYSYTLFNYGKKTVNEDGSPEYVFGEIPEGASFLYSSAFDLVIYYVDNGEDGGWFISPEFI